MKQINYNKYINFLWEKNLSQKTITDYVNTIKRFFKYSNNLISKNICVNFIRDLQKNAKPSSVFVAHNHIVQFCIFKKFKWINEFKNIKLPKTQHYSKCIIKKETFSEILSKLNNSKFNDLRIHVWLRILFETGLRTCEFIKLKTSDIISQNFCFEVLGKGNKLRKVFISEDLKNFIKKNWFYENICILQNGKIAANSTVRKITSDFFKKFKLENISLHSIRRSFCTNLIRKNCNLKMVQMLMGHSNIQTTAKYIIFDDQDVYQEYIRCL